MKVFIAVEHNKNGQRSQWTDDVNMIVYCAESLEDWPKVAGFFNSLKLPARHHSLNVDISEQWVIREIGETQLFNEMTIIEYAVADS